MAIGINGLNPPTRVQFSLGIQSGHQHHHNSNAHHGDHTTLSRESRTEGPGGGSHPLLNGLNENFGGCRGGNPARQLQQSLSKWENAKCPKAKRAAAQELGQNYQECKSKGVKLDPKTELKVVLILAMSGTEGSKDGGRCGDSKPPGGGGSGGCKDKKPHGDHEHGGCKDKKPPHDHEHGGCKDKKKPRCEKGKKPHHHSRPKTRQA